MCHTDLERVSLREYSLIIGARRKAKDADFKAQRVLNQEMGVLNKFAYHDPKNMPDFTKQGDVGKRSSATDKRAGLAALSSFFLNSKARAETKS
ncbi:hypothetical protein KL867_17750 [Ruegeria litorea]|uniref:Uncharacterized protein n=1 Tax=Falsiruegeria litorea TaxID=1280831 RepID=A0ABS5WUV1_9RHOB|nr:hypothetical protein [Falsiruegeria litorea]MBT3142917.1 hypothetical protein [Falsiruegeria litorea]